MFLFSLQKRKSSVAPASVKWEDLTEVKKLGKGAFGVVSHMRWKKDSKTEVDVAAKQLIDFDGDELEALRHELDFLSTLEHPNIVRLLGIVPEMINYTLILELCNGGSLRRYLSDQREPLPLNLQRHWAVQAAKAIEYLQDMGVIHKDVKSDNYLISSNGTLKLADFGLSKWTERTLNDATHRGTIAYMAPEIFTDNILSMKFDIFAYGVVVWEIVTRQIPFDGQKPPHIMFTVCKGKRLPIPEDCPEDLAYLMRHCWLENRHQRLNIHDILSVLAGQRQLPGTNCRAKT